MQPTPPFPSIQQGYQPFSQSNFMVGNVPSRGIVGRIEQVVMSRSIFVATNSFPGALSATVAFHEPTQDVLFACSALPSISCVKQNALQKMHSFDPTARNMLVFCGRHMPKFQFLLGGLDPFIRLKRFVDSCGIDIQQPESNVLFAIKTGLANLAHAEPSLAAFFCLSDSSFFNALVSDVFEYLCLRSRMPLPPSLPFYDAKIPHLDNWEAVFWGEPCVVEIVSDEKDRRFLAYIRDPNNDGAPVSCSFVRADTDVIDQLSWTFPLDQMKDLIKEAVKLGISSLVKMDMEDLFVYCSFENDRDRSDLVKRDVPQNMATEHQQMCMPQIYGVPYFDNTCRFHILHQRFIPFLNYINEKHLLQQTPVTIPRARVRETMEARLIMLVMI
jgi:hypothetical protein